MLLAGLVAGVLSAGPQALIWYHLSKDGKPYVVMQLTHHLDESVQYMPRAREVYDGHWFPSDLSMDEPSYTMFPAFPPLVFSVFLRATGGSVEASYILMTLVFSSIIFLLFTLGAYSFTRNKALAVCVGTFSVFAAGAHGIPYVFFSHVGFINGVVKKFIPLIHTVLERHPISRFDDPLITLPVFLIALLLFWNFWKKPVRRNAVFAAVSLGWLFYTYLHYWVYLVVVVGLLFLYAMWSRKEDSERFKNFIVFGALVAVLIIPYAINYVSFSSTPGIEDYVQRIGLMRYHTPDFGNNVGGMGPKILLHYLFYAVMAVLAYRTWFSRDKIRAIFFLALIAAMYIVWNIQVVTGFTPHPDHFGKPISPVLLCILAALFAEYAYRYVSRRVIVGLLCVLTALLFAKAAVNLAAIASNPPQDLLLSYTFDPNVVESWKWINSSLPHEPKIISPSLATSYYLYNYTSARPYLPTTENTMKDNFALSERYLVSNKLFDVPVDAMIAGLHNGEDPRLDFLYYNFYHRDSSSISKIPQSVLDDLRARYGTLRPEWQKVEAEYVYLGPNEKEIMGANFSEKGLNPIYRNEGVAIYKIWKE